MFDTGSVVLFAYWLAVCLAVEAAVYLLLF
jgi:hypothetical protein